MGLYYGFLVAAVLFGIAGQITLKSGAVASSTIAAQFLSPLTIVGFAIYLVAGLCYVIALKKLPVSIAFPSVAASYAIVAILGHVLWNEPFGLAQIGGLFMIGGGIFLIHQY